MTAAIDVIHAALEHLGAHSVIRPAGPETIARSLVRLGQVIEEWRGEDFDVGATVPTIEAADLNEFNGARTALEYELAFKMSTPLQKPVSRELRIQGDKSIRLARDRWQYNLPDQRKRRPLVGQGNRTWR